MVDIGDLDQGSRMVIMLAPLWASGWTNRLLKHP